MLPARGRDLFLLLEGAGKAALAAWHHPMTFKTKSDGTPVTAGDLASDAVLVRGLQARFPHDPLVTEESGGNPGNQAWWVIDPIDGTSSYIEGLAHWGPVVARLVATEGTFALDCGAIWLPRLSEHYHVEFDGTYRGWYNGRPLEPVNERQVPRTIYLPSRFHRHFRLDYTGKTRCLGGTAAHLALVARGAAEAAIVAPGWKAWDTAAGLGLIAASGGVAARLPGGEPLNPVQHEGVPFVAGLPKTVAHLLVEGTILPLLSPPSKDFR